MDLILYQFDLTATDTTALLPQATAALEKHTELKSRQKYPAMWARTDKARAAVRPRSRWPRKLLSILCMAMGIFLLVPGLMQPKELAAPLFAGILGITSGVYGLTRHRMVQWLKNSQTAQYQKAAARLLEGKATLESNRYTVCFGTDGFAVTDAVDGDRLDIPYTRLECVIAAQDVYLLFYDDKALLLQKRDLAGGGAENFYAFIAEKTSLKMEIRQEI